MKMIINMELIDRIINETSNGVNIVTYDDSFCIRNKKSIEGISCFAKVNDMKNIVISHEKNKFKNCRFLFTGRGVNLFFIGKSKFTISNCLFKFFGNSKLIIGNNFSGDTVEFRLGEEKDIVIRNDCMCSQQVLFLTSDGHSILNEDGKCINGGGGYMYR